MSETMKTPTFRVEFDKVCSACGSECPYLEVQEFEVHYGFPETRKRRNCKNEKICRNVVVSEYLHFKKLLDKNSESKEGTEDD